MWRAEQAEGGLLPGTAGLLPEQGLRTTTLAEELCEVQLRLLITGGRSQPSRADTASCIRDKQRWLLGADDQLLCPLKGTGTVHAVQTSGGEVFTVLWSFIRPDFSWSVWKSV